jgi:serine protease Do
MRRKIQLNNQKFSIILSVLLLSAASLGFAGESVLKRMEQEFQTIVKSARPAVVEIIATRTVSLTASPKKGGAQLVEQDKVVYHFQNIGSGIIIDTAGYIVTTGAVVGEANQIDVKFADGELHRAKLIGIDPLTDIAVLNVAAARPFQTAIGDATQVDAGSWVITVGSSYGQCPTLAFGIVSGFEILPNRPYYDALKINTTVTPGNSGGAVVDTSGKIVGLIAATLAEPNPIDITGNASPEHAIARSLLSNDGILMGREIGFAIPIQTVQSVAEQLIQYGRVQRGWLGVWIESDKDGARIKSVDAKSPAQKAGLLPQDVILEFDGAPVRTYLDLKKRVATSTPNTRVTLRIRRGEKPLQREVVLGELK